jgi:hypothetical protein
VSSSHCYLDSGSLPLKGSATWNSLLSNSNFYEGSSQTCLKSGPRGVGSRTDKEMKVSRL